MHSSALIDLHRDIIFRITTVVFKIVTKRHIFMIQYDKHLCVISKKVVTCDKCLNHWLPWWFLFLCYVIPLYQEKVYMRLKRYILNNMECYVMKQSVIKCAMACRSSPLCATWDLAALYCWHCGPARKWLELNLLPHHTTTVLWPFFQDHQGEPVPEENFWTSWCKGRLTEADTPTIRLGATPSGLTSAHLHPPIFYRSNALSAAQPTVSKHWRQLAKSAKRSIFQLSANLWSVPF